MSPSPDDRLADMLTRSRQHGWAPGTLSRDRSDAGGAGIGEPFVRPAAAEGSTRRYWPLPAASSNADTAAATTHAGATTDSGVTTDSRATTAAGHPVAASAGGLTAPARGSTRRSGHRSAADDDDLAADDPADDDEIMALLPGNRPIPKRWIVLALLCITVLGVVGFVLLRGPGEEPTPEPSSAAEGQAGTAQPGPSAGSTGPVQVSAGTEEVTAHVVGAVGRPGVVRLPGGSRVVDAIEAAGGLSEKAEASGVNLARLVEDGEQIVVPDRAAAAAENGGAAPAAGDRASAGRGPAGSGAGSAAGSGGAGAGGASGGRGGAGSQSGGQAGSKVNINSAGPADLETLQGVGPATAQAIISHREENGPFSSVEDLVLVHGIGEATLARLRDHITVG